MARPIEEKKKAAEKLLPELRAPHTVLPRKPCITYIGSSHLLYTTYGLKPNGLEYIVHHHIPPPRHEDASQLQHALQV
ncbi:MAG: hypothetical protein AB1352_00570, partial [Patescibacteria group bacterium]